MRLRNKKTGKVANVVFYSPVGSHALRLWEDTDYLDVTCDDNTLGAYNSLAELNEEWEDYKPAEPLIKDEKIRKAVRAWAEMNDIRFIHMCSRTRKENARIVGQNALGRTFTMEIDNEYEIRVSFKDYKECYTLAELCGEEEE